jgi:hypothetical protein
MASEGADPLWQKLVITSAILGWSGLAIHAQVASVIAETDMKMTVFVLTRIGHGVLAAVLTFLFTGPLRAGAEFLFRPVFLPQAGIPTTVTAYYSFSLTQLILFFSLAAGLALIVRLVRHISLRFRHWPVR